MIRAWIVVLAVTRVAVAEPDRDRVGLTATTGFEVMGGSGVSQLASRSGLALVIGHDTGRVQPALAVGVTFGWGQLSTEDPRALDGRVSVGYLSYGPAIQIGARFGRHGIVRDRVYAGFAFLATDLDDRLELDRIEGLGGSRGTRVTIGGGWPRTQARLNTPDTPNYSILGFLVPQYGELGWERSAGSDRFGFSLAWGL